MSKDGKTPSMLPSLVVGLLREKIRQRDARIVVLEAKNAGLAVKNEPLRAGTSFPTLGGLRNFRRTHCVRAGSPTLPEPTDMAVCFARLSVL